MKNRRRQKEGKKGKRRDGCVVTMIDDRGGVMHSIVHQLLYLTAQRILLSSSL